MSRDSSRIEEIRQEGAAARDEAAAPPDRQALRRAIVESVYASSTMAVFFHALIAARLGLGATEEKALLILGGMGSITAGQLADQTGLTTAAATSLIDRLEARGYVRRVRDAADRRRVIVEPDRTRLAELQREFAALQTDFTDLLDRYSDEQLTALADFLTTVAARARRAMDRLRETT
jgi:DNA-binding MarR family transcriptional regulator